MEKPVKQITKNFFQKSYHEIPSHTLRLRYIDEQYKFAATGCLVDLCIQSDDILDSPTSGQTKAKFA
jgi:hypothetical protein